MRVVSPYVCAKHRTPSENKVVSDFLHFHAKLRPPADTVFLRIECKQLLLSVIAWLLAYLTFKNHASYIQDGRTATLQILHFVYIFFNKYKY